MLLEGLIVERVLGHDDGGDIAASQRILDDPDTGGRVRDIRNDQDKAASIVGLAHDREAPARPARTLKVSSIRAIAACAAGINMERLWNIAIIATFRRIASNGGGY
jgi:hypothetical protein